MIDVTLDCEIGKWVHRYHPLIKYSLQEIAEKTRFPLGYLSKLKPSGNAPEVAIPNLSPMQSGVFVSGVARWKYALVRCDRSFDKIMKGGGNSS